MYLRLQLSKLVSTKLSFEAFIRDSLSQLVNTAWPNIWQNVLRILSVKLNLKS